MAELTPEQFRAMLGRGVVVDAPGGLVEVLKAEVARATTVEDVVVALGRVRQRAAEEVVPPAPTADELQREQVVAQREAWAQRCRGVRIQHAQGVVCSALGVLFGEAPLGQSVSEATRDLAEEATRKALRVLMGALDE